MDFQHSNHNFDHLQEYDAKHFYVDTWNVVICLIILQYCYILIKSILDHRYWIVVVNQVLNNWKVKYNSYNEFHFSKVHFHQFHTNSV